MLSQRLSELPNNPTPCLCLSFYHTLVWIYIIIPPHAFVYPSSHTNWIYHFFSWHIILTINLIELRSTYRIGKIPLWMSPMAFPESINQVRKICPACGGTIPKAGGLGGQSRKAETALHTQTFSASAFWSHSPSCGSHHHDGQKPLKLWAQEVFPLSASVTETKSVAHCPSSLASSHLLLVLYSGSLKKHVIYSCHPPSNMLVHESLCQVSPCHHEWNKCPCSYLADSLNVALCGLHTTKQTSSWTPLHFSPMGA